MAGTQKPSDGQTQRLQSVGHYSKDTGSLQHVEPDLFYTTATGGEDHEIHSPPLSNGNVSVPHTSCRRGTENNPMLDKRWVSHKTGGGASNRRKEGASRPRTVWAFQAAPLHRRANEVLQVPAILAPQSHMSQLRVLCNLQRQTRDKCLHKEAQGGTSYNGAMRKLQREPSCMESQMPRTSETDSERTMPGHNPAKKRKGSYTEEADNLGDCPLNIRNVKNRLLCGNIKRSSQASANSQAPKGEKATKAKKSHQHCRAAIKSRCGGKFPQGEERPGTSREVDGEGKGQSKNKENGFCTNTDITSKGDPNPQKGKKGVCDTNFTNENPGHQDPGHIEGRGLQFVRTPTSRNDADLRHCTGIATQHNAANRTGQECNESHSQCLEIPDQDQRRQDEEIEQNVNQSGRGHEHIDGDNRPLKILQWNLNSFNAKRNFLMVTAYSEQMDVILLQETRIKLGHTPKVRGYRVFSEPEIPQQSRGCMILVKNDIPCAKIEEPMLCGEGWRHKPLSFTLVCYNVYKRHAGVLDISELMSEAANNKVFIGGDFNAHHRRLESPGPCNRMGIHIIQTLNEMPGVRLLNNGEPTHRDGGRLDLSFISEELCEGSTWEVHPN